MSIPMYHEKQVKYNLIKKESILNFQKDVYDHNEEGFLEVADEHKCSVAGLAALWDEDSSSGAGGFGGHAGVCDEVSVYLSRRLSSTGAHIQRPGINTTMTAFH